MTLKLCSDFFYSFCTWGNVHQLKTKLSLIHCLLLKMFHMYGWRVDLLKRHKGWGVYFSAWRFSTLHVYKLRTRACVPRVISHCLTSQEPLSWFDTEVTLRYHLSIQQYQGAVRWKFNNDLPQGYRMDRVGFTWSILHFICINDDILSNRRTILKKKRMSIKRVECR